MVFIVFTIRMAGSGTECTRLHANEVRVAEEVGDYLRNTALDRGTRLRSCVY